MICPNCNGNGFLLILSKDCPAMPCLICERTGILPEYIRYDPDAGKDMKRGRLRMGLTLRQYCKLYGVNAVVRGRNERGFFEKKATTLLR